MPLRASGMFGLVVMLMAASTIAQSKHIHEQTDPFSKLNSLYLGDITTTACQGDPRLGNHDADVELIVSAHQTKEHTVAYFLTADIAYRGGNTLYLGKGGTMDSLMDGGVGYFVTPVGSTVTTAYDSNDRSYIHESILFDVTLDNLKVLAATQLFQFRINGPKQSLQRCTDAKHLRDLAEFLRAASTY